MPLRPSAGNMLRVRLSTRWPMRVERGPVVVAHTFNPTQEAEARGSEFKSGLVSRVSFRMARATQRDHLREKENGIG